MNVPALSVVVPSVNGWPDLRDCMIALRENARDVQIEILVVDRVGDPVRVPLRAEFPEAVLLEAAPGTTIPDMRAAAIRRAASPLVAILEDHVLVPEGWARSMIGAQMRHGGVVGGSVTNVATERLVDRAAFLSEYGQVMPPLAAGPTERLAGNNIVYPRALLEAHRGIVESGRWEDWWHREFRRTGTALTCCPEITVFHRERRPAREYLSQKFYYARSFAGGRVAGRAAAVRLAYGLGAFLLPPALLGRIVGRVWTKRLHRRDVLRSLPFIGLLVSAWGAGEVVGYWFGPGNALSRVC